MEVFQYVLRKLLAGIPLVLGVTLISFVLIVYFGPDKTYELLGKNPTADEIAEIRSQLGYDQPFVTRYMDYLREIVTLGNLLGVVLALVAAYYRGFWVDKFIMGFAAVGMSISFLIAIIGFQILFSSSDGLDLLPVRGWDMSTPLQYIRYVTVPTLATVFVALGYNTRFYRAVIVEEMTRDHVRTARAFGVPPVQLFYRNILKNSMIPIVTRIMFSIPVIVISGSLLLESYFGIPGVGKVTYDAIVTGDQPILKAVVVLTAVLFVIAQLLADICYRVVDPRVSLK